MKVDESAAVACAYWTRTGNAAPAALPRAISARASGPSRRMRTWREFAIHTDDEAMCVGVPGELRPLRSNTPAQRTRAPMRPTSACMGQRGPGESDPAPAKNLTGLLVAGFRRRLTTR